jgi:hypothetical protein
MILYGLIDKNNHYILQNGTLIYPRGNSVLVALADNDVAIGGLIVNSNAQQRNWTQQLMDANQEATSSKLLDLGKSIVNSIVGNLQLWLAVLLILLVLLMFYTLFLKDRLRRYDRRLKEPQCYGDPRVFEPEQACRNCRLKEDCERQIIAATTNMQAEERPKKKKRFLRRKEEPGEEQVEKPPCFRQYLAGDPECVKCMDAKECMGETPGLSKPADREHLKNTAPAAGAFDPLAGM